MKLIFKLTIAIFITLLCVKLTSACLCFPPQSPNKGFSAVNSVFVRTVTKITPAKRAVAVMPLSGERAGRWERRDEDVLIVNFEVREIFKGVESSSIELVNTVSLCSFSFKEGQNYLVYANERATARQLYANEAVSKSMISAIDNFNRGLSPLETDICTRTDNLKNTQEEVAQIRKLAERTKRKSGKQKGARKPK